jgi:DNA helicase II / ATP-dependent DNA helicase PcrA
MELNDMQKKVVYSNERFLFLLAGAGSGKTRVVIERIKHLINLQVLETKILALTFTNKAAQEMKDRIGKEYIKIHTFHQFCFQELKKKCDYSFNIYNEEEHHFTKKELLDITTYKNSYYKNKKPKVYQSYQRYLLDHKMKDFDDLLLDFYELVKQKNDYDFLYIFVDEFQDTNQLQYMILKMLIKDYTYCLCVGDPDQSIYRFRGANSKIIDQYVKDFNAKVEKLTINYRSNMTIINHANRLIKRNYRNYKKDLIPSKTHTNHIESYVFMSQEQESEFILNRVKSLIHQGLRPQDIAILYRKHHRCYHLIQHLKTEEFIYYQEITFDQIHHHIHVLSVHQAKGLEFAAVIILGLESNIFPSYQTDQKVLLEEERRLMFVAMTRAKEHLIFTHIRYNQYFQRQKPSLFIKESGIKTKIYKT